MMNHTSPPAASPDSFCVALLPWGDLIEDFLDLIGVSFEQFQSEMTGGWLFGLISTLQEVEVRAVLICFSARVHAPKRVTHAPSGATLWVLPPTRLYRALRLCQTAWLRPAPHVPARRAGRLLWRLTRRLKQQVALPLLTSVLPYLSTPPRQLAGVLKREKCRAIICQEYEYPRFDCCVLLGKRLRLPVFATFQGGVWRLSALERWLRPLCVRACSGLVIAPRQEIERVRARFGAPRAKIARIFNPISPSLWRIDHRAQTRARVREELGLSPQTRVVVCHGRIDIKRKGLDVLLDAWQQVCAEQPGADLRLLLVGAGDDSAALHALIAQHNIPNVLWIDRYVLDRSEMKGYLCAADVSVLPSRHEGFPVAPLEAMACGLPVVAADAPGVPDILEGGEASGGLVVPRGDAPALARALARLLGDEELRARLAHNAQERIAEQFSPRAVGQAWRAFLETRGVLKDNRTG